jgi:hypothetical protein
MFFGHYVRPVYVDPQAAAFLIKWVYTFHFTSKMHFLQDFQVSYRRDNLSTDLFSPHCASGILEIQLNGTYCRKGKMEIQVI